MHSRAKLTIYFCFSFLQSHAESEKARAARLEEALLKTRYSPYSSSENVAPSNGKELPSDPRKAISILQHEMQRAIMRLELNPVKFFNMANKSKAKFLGKPEISS